MNTTNTNENTNTSLEEKLAQVAAALQGQSLQPTTEAASSGAFVCPIDPAERALCEACQ